MIFGVFRGRFDELRRSSLVKLVLHAILANFVAQKLQFRCENNFIPTFLVIILEKVAFIIGLRDHGFGPEAELLGREKVLVRTTFVVRFGGRTLVKLGVV
jgi:hypothetical protein